ncbi:MAG: hypothetical protein DRJ69_03450 [Thermoprotei archaeon]|nr:MAG: hypothetical protein DRJ69_03450 [Thermoprotei archaeon]
MSKINVVFITRWYVPEWKACTIRILYFVKSFLSVGANVYVLILRSPHELPCTRVDCEHVINVKLFHFPRKITAEYFSLLTNMPRLVNKLSKIIMDINAIIASVPPADTAFMGYYLSKFLNSKLIIDVRDLWEYTIADIYTWHFPKLQHILSKPYISSYLSIAERADLITTSSVGQKVFYELNYRVNRNKLRVIYNGSDSGLFSRYIRQRCESDTFIGIGLGEYEARYQMLSTILYIISKVLRKGINIKLRAIGKIGSLDFIHDSKVKDKVEIIKPLPYEMLPIVMKNASFGVIGRPNTLPWKLSVPVKLFDYIACGLPIFAFGPPKSELQFFIERFGLGMYVPSNDVDVLANKLVEFIKNLDNYDRKHILKVARFFDRRKWAKRFVKVVESLL